MDPRLSPEHFRAVIDALRCGSKIEAVKLYREATGLGLAECKDAVERIEAGAPSPPPLPAAPSGTGLTPAQRAAVIEAVSRGRKIEAIKLYREATGRGLAEAKDAVEALERSVDGAPRSQSEPGLAPGGRTPLPHWDPAEEKRKGCFAVVAILAAVAAAVIASR